MGIDKCVGTVYGDLKSENVIYLNILFVSSTFSFLLVLLFDILLH